MPTGSRNFRPPLTAEGLAKGSTLTCRTILVKTKTATSRIVVDQLGARGVTMISRRFRASKTRFSRLMIQRVKGEIRDKTKSNKLISEINGPESRQTSNSSVIEI